MSLRWRRQSEPERSRGEPGRYLNFGQQEAEKRPGQPQHTQQVHILVDSVAGNGGEAELLDEFTAHINNLTLEGTDLHGLLARGLEVLCLV